MRGITFRYTRRSLSGSRVAQTLKTSDRFLYTVLLGLENELTTEYRTNYYRSISDLMNDTALSNKTIIAGLKRLSENNFIKKWRKPMKRNGSGKNTKETITFIQIL